MVIWQTSLPHTSSINIGSTPRVVQYITMSPASGPQDEGARAGRIKFCAERLAGVSHAYLLVCHHEYFSFTSDRCGKQNGNAELAVGEATTSQPGSDGVLTPLVSK
jgi:hypothetical protein